MPRCTFIDEDNRRCRRNGFGNPPLCDDHTGGEYDEVIDVVLSHPAMSGVAAGIEGLLSKLTGFIDAAAKGEIKLPPRQPPPTSSRRPQDAPRPPKQPPSPQALQSQARVIMGFAETTPLTITIIKERKRALAKLYHPDHGGSPEAMTKLNRAAEILLESLK